MQNRPDNSMPPPIVIDCQSGDANQLLAKEWLLSNDIGAYASATVVGCNTRRYHSLLVGATAPPTGKIAALSSVMERLIVGEQSFDLSVNQFGETLAGGGLEYLAEFRNEAAPTFVFQIGKIRLTKEIVLAQSANVVALRYTIAGGDGRLELSPLSAMRDFHQLRRSASSQFTFEARADGVVILRDAEKADRALYMSCRGAQFLPQALWWHNFHYRAELARGQGADEDLYTPGKFVCHLSDGGSCQFTAALNEPPELDFENTLNQRRDKLKSLADSVGPRADESTRRLAQASDTFIVRRKLPDGSDSATILAGYHWFADWGRDAFIALPGLLLSTGRFDLAREVFSTFARYQDGGLIPNRFDDYTSQAHYNSVDASLWFIIAAERYMSATEDAGDAYDKSFWRRLLMPKALAILEHYQAGEQFDIHADTDSLLWAGSAQTQLTWMDAATNEQAVTPRYGKAVEINALWYNAHKILAHRCAEDDAELARKFALRAETIAKSFVKTFWNERTQCLLDCVNEQSRDESIRPNQLFALCLPHSPLPENMQASIVRVVTKHLLTPTGLRTLSPSDGGYRGQYTGLSPEQRDRAYHQGTVWAFLTGPFIEAYLKVNHRSPLAIAQAKHWLMTLDDHLSQAGLGFVSEVFDGDKPHQPGGCIAQAWSVAELLRIKKLITDKQ